jgi:translation elongation factor EF-Ts
MSVQITAKMVKDLREATGAGRWTARKRWKHPAAISTRLPNTFRDKGLARARKAGCRPDDERRRYRSL